MNDNNMEEVPLDLFSQVSLDEYEKAEDVPTAEAPKEEAPAPVGPGVISIPLNAYASIREKERRAKEAASPNAAVAPQVPIEPDVPVQPVAPAQPAATVQQTVMGPTVVQNQTGVNNQI